MNSFVKISLAFSLLLSVNAVADESFGGVGITIVPTKEGARVIEVIPGSPAKEAGIEPQDKIFKVDAVSLAEKSFDEVRESLRGQTGKPVEVSVIRGIDTLSVTIRRGTITIKDFSEKSIQEWYGKDKTSYSKEELEAIAVQNASSEKELLSVMSRGYVVAENEVVSGNDVSAVFIDKEKVFENPKENGRKVAVKGDAKLTSFNRSVIGFKTPYQGNVRVVVTDANGQVYLDKLILALPGANLVSWDASKVPSGRYSIALEQDGKVSTYFSVLK